MATTAETRVALQQVAVHVLARRRHAVTGRFGLRPTPGGLGTPLFGEGEVVRVSGDVLVVERDRDAWDEPLTSLARAAALVRVDLAEDFSAGRDAPPLADPEADLGLDAAIVRDLGDWWAMGAVLMDELVATTPEITAASIAQLWPEHFDHACTLTLAGDVKVNVGASPGDGDEPEPYLYVGPWGPDRPDDAGYLECALRRGAAQSGWHRPAGVPAPGDRAAGYGSCSPGCWRASTFVSSVAGTSGAA